MTKQLLILDIDETLVYASETPLPNPQPDFEVGPYAVYRRPYLTDFLTATADWFDLAVWSSASSSYVHGVVSALFTDFSSLCFVWSAEKCTQRFDPEYRTYHSVKKLKKVVKAGYPLERIVMVDDSPEKLSQNYGNHVRIHPYTGDHNDTELRDLLPFLNWLRTVKNVRSVEKRNWRTYKSDA